MERRALAPPLRVNFGSRLSVMRGAMRAVDVLQDY